MNLHLIGSDVAGLIGQILGRKVGGMWETLLVKECFGSVKTEADGPQAMGFRQRLKIEHIGVPVYNIAEGRAIRLMHTF